MYSSRGILIVWKEEIWTHYSIQGVFTCCMHVMFCIKKRQKMQDKCRKCKINAENAEYHVHETCTSPPNPINNVSSLPDCQISGICFAQRSIQT